MANDSTPNKLHDYANISSTAIVGFKAGSQTALNALIENGGATEGVFYLTNDTHKLYVGRKSTTDAKVYPEQVSRGVTIVKTSGDLNTVPPSAREEGELYYITKNNILAALVYDSSTTSWKWQQVNPGTGISSLALDVGIQNGNSIYLEQTITAENGSTTGSAVIAKSGTNITIIQDEAGIPTISAVNTEYSPGVIGSTTSGIIGLQPNGSNAVNSTTVVTLVGQNGIIVSGTNNGNTINITGATFNQIVIDNNGVQGFDITIPVTNANGTSTDITNTIDPVISYGKSSSRIAAHFESGVATLDVYSTTQTNEAIEKAIERKIALMDALVYKGVVNSWSDLKTKVVDSGAHNGDVYKSNATGFFEIGDLKIYPGDLIILHGKENDEGIITKTEDNTNITINASIPPTTFQAICDIIPSGDEPVYEVVYDSSTTAPHITISDQNNSTDKILDIALYSGTNISLSQNTNGTNYSQVTINHASVTRTNITDSTITSAIAETTANMASNYSFFALAPSSTSGYGIKTDAQGHVTNLYGKVITLTHNRLSSAAVDYDVAGKISLELKDLMNVSTTAEFSFTSQTLTFTNANNAVNINLNWGSF